MLDYRQISEKLVTVRDFIRFGMSIFNRHELYFGHGTDNAFDEAAALAMHVLACPHDKFEWVQDAKLTEQEKHQLLALFERRVEQRMPLPYLTNEAYFCGLKFYVDEQVLIPRSPIAELIENQFAPWVNADDVAEVLELCTGSGCIAVALAYAFEDAEVTASDISEQALQIAKKNIEAHGVDEQVKLVQADVFAGIEQKSYDLIVSNPPYVSQIEMDSLPEEYRHEPELALKACDEGLAIVDKILAEATNYLSPEGVLVVEVGNSKQALMKKYPKMPLTWLDFERGGDGVFLITAEQLKK